MDEGNSGIQESISSGSTFKSILESKWFAAALLALLCIGAYWNSLDGSFQYDDYHTIRFNLSLRESNWLTRIHSFGSRPLSYLSIALNYSISRGNPTSYHIFNLAAHLIAVYLFYLLLKRKSTDFWIPLIAASFMALHPLNTESVSYITSRSIILCAIFYLLCLLSIDSYVNERTWRSFSAFFLFFCLAALSKENAAVIPVVALFYVWIFYGKEGVLKSRNLLIAAILLSIVAAAYRLSIFPYHGNVPPVSTYLATEANVWIRYLWLSIYPASLNVEHDVHPLNLSSQWFIGSLILIVAISILFWTLRKKYPFLTFWGLWFFLNLAPSSVIPLNEFMSEHSTYISLFGFCGCLAYTLMKICKPFAKPAFLIWIIISLICALYLFGTIQRNKVWKDELSLWSDAVAKSPTRIRPRMNLANAYIRLNEYQKAIGEYSMILSYNPRSKEAFSGIGIAYFRMKAHFWAENYFRKALQTDKDFVDAKVGLGLIAHEKNNCPDSLKYLESVYPVRWTSDEVVRAMADCYAQMNRLDDGIRVVKRCIEKGPTESSLYAALMELYFTAKQPKKALEVFDQYQNFFPITPISRLQVASMLNHLGRKEQARMIVISVTKDPKYGKLAFEILKSIEGETKAN